MIYRVHVYIFIYVLQISNERQTEVSVCPCVCVCECVPYQVLKYSFDLHKTCWLILPLSKLYLKVKTWCHV